jgi:hypothetical protein
MKNSDFKVQCSASHEANCFFWGYFAFYSPKEILLRPG